MRQWMGAGWEPGRTYYTPRSDLCEPLPPHIYEVVNNTYLQMRKEGGAQGMVISGEANFSFSKQGQYGKPRP